MPIWGQALATPFRIGPAACRRMLRKVGGETLTFLIRQEALRLPGKRGGLDDRDERLDHEGL